MAGDGAILAATAAAVYGVALLRLSWGLPRRSTSLNAVAWLLLGGAAVLGALGAGAWGMAVTMLVATGTAALVLVHSALEPSRALRRSSTTAAAAAAAATTGATTARPGNWPHGLATFLIAGPLALAAAVLVALAIRSLALLWPVAEADGNVIVLALVPLVWPLLAFAVLMTEGRRPQLAMLAGTASIAALALFLTGFHA